MNIEKEIFKRGSIDLNQLIRYGFLKERNIYHYSKVFMRHFRADVFVTSDGQVTGKVYDLDMNDEYVNFRNSRSGKWFGAILNVDQSKIIHNLSGEIEIINLKLDDKVFESLNIKGIYPAYHMNKKSWVSVILDDTLSDEEIMRLVDISYEQALLSGSWIIPANPKYYDVIDAFSKSDVIMWHQDIKVIVGDFVYIYLTKPYQAILFQCEVIEADILDLDNSLSMKIKLLKKYDVNEFPISKLNLYGVKSVRSARSIPKGLAEELKK